MLPSCTMKLPMKGSSVSARAGMIGSGNMRVTRKTEIICPKARTMAMYMKETKCESVKMLKIPQNSSKLKLPPLRKKTIRQKWNELKELMRNMERKGG